MILGAVVLGQLAEVLHPPLDAQLKGEQRLELESLYGAQQDHGVWRRADKEGMQTRLTKVWNEQLPMKGLCEYIIH